MFSVDQITGAIVLLENTPIFCVIIVELIMKLRENWLKKTICIKSEHSQILN